MNLILHKVVLNLETTAFALLPLVVELSARTGHNFGGSA